MKNRKIATIILLVTLGITVSACGKKSNEAVSAADIQATDSSESLNSDKQEFKTDNNIEIDLETAVIDSFTREEALGPEVNEMTNVSYHIPKIDLDMPGAAAINSEIEKDFDDIISLPGKIDYYPSWWKVGWNAYLNDDVLSLIITKQSTMDDYSVTNAYNLNIKTGNELDNEELLKIMGLSEEEYLSGLRKSAAYEVDKGMYTFLGPDYMSDDIEIDIRQRMHGEFLHLRRDTISKDNICIDLPMYVNDNGELTVATEIGVLAGGGTYEQYLNIDSESRAKDFKLAYKDSMFVEYSQGMMTIKIEESDWADQVFKDANIEYGKEYPVHGVYKDYVEGCIVVGENDDFGYPAFLSDDGLIAMLQPYECAQGAYFCLNEPMFNISGVEALENNPKAHDAVRAGMTMLFPEYTQEFMGLYNGDGVSYEKEKADGGEKVKHNYYLGFNMDNPYEFLYQDSVYDKEEYLCYNGVCHFIGMDENGAVFNYSISNDANKNDKKHGLFSIKRCNDWIKETDEWLDWAEYTYIGGDLLFDENGSDIKLDISQG